MVRTRTGHVRDAIPNEVGAFERIHLLVVAAHGRQYVVELPDGVLLPCGGQCIELDIIVWMAPEMSVNEIELSVRAANCLNNANITAVGQLAMKSEAEMLKYRNFGKKSLNEIKDKLVELGLGLGMSFESSLLSGPAAASRGPRLGAEDEAPVGLADLIAQNLDD